MLTLMALLTLATLLVYSQVWQFEFVVMDDPLYVSENPHVLTGINLRNLTWAFTTHHAGFWIPLTWLSLMLDGQMYGPDPGGYHVTNVLLHAVNTLLLFRLLAQATGNHARSAFVAALFALHPLHVESVAWITERKDVLSTMFGLLSLSAYVHSATRGRRSSLVVSFLFFICSLMAKPTLVTLPFVFLLLDIWPLRRLHIADEMRSPAARPGRRQSQRVPPTSRHEGRSLGVLASPVLRLVAEKTPFLAASVAFSAIAFIAQRSAQGVAPLAGYPLSERSENALVAYAAYLRKTFVPNDLAVFYPYPRGQLAWADVAVAATLVLAISMAAIIWARRYPFLLVGWLWYLGTLVPMIGIVQVGRQQMADRFTYFPSIGLFVAFAWLAAEIVPAGSFRDRLLPAAAIAGLMALAATCFLQVGCWRDSFTLFRHAQECGHDSAFARSVLGHSLLARGEATEGMALLNSAVAMDPADPQLEFNLAAALQSLGQLDAAARHYQASLLLNERDAEVHANLGVVLLKRHEYQAARRNFSRAIELDPDRVEAYVNLGVLCGETGDFTGSIAYNERALDLDPGSIMAHHNLAMALMAGGRLDEAISQFQYLLTVLPDDHGTRRNLERALALKRGSAGK